MKEEIVKFLGSEEERRKNIIADNPYAILAEILVTRSYTSQLLEKVVSGLVERQDEDALYLLGTVVRDPIQKAEIVRKAGMIKRALEILLNSLVEEDRETARKVARKIQEIAEENTELLLSIARILKKRGLNEDAKLIGETILFKLQGAGRYEESFEIQKKYKEIFE